MAKTDQLSFAELREINVTRCLTWHPLEDWSESEWMVAVCGEIGEAANIIKKRRRAPWIAADHPQQQGISDTDLAKEFADAIIYLDLLAARVGIDLGAAVRSKFNEVSERYGIEHRLGESRG